MNKYYWLIILNYCLLCAMPLSLNAMNHVATGSALGTEVNRTLARYQTLLRNHGQNKVFARQRSPSLTHLPTELPSEEWYNSEVARQTDKEVVQRAYEIDECIRCIQKLETTSVKEIASLLIEKFNDPLELVSLSLKKVGTLKNKLGISIDGQTLIEELVNLGSEPTKVPDYVQRYLSDRSSRCYYKIEAPSFGQLELPATIPLAPISSIKSSVAQLQGNRENNGLLKNVDDHILETIGSYLDEKSFGSLIATNHSIRFVLLNDISKRIPPALIPSRRLDSQPWDCIHAFGMHEGQLIRELSTGLTSYRPNIGIALDLYGYEDAISVDVINKLAQYPIIALYCHDRNAKVMFPDGLAQLARLPRLRELYLRNMEISEFPAELCKLRELVHLNLSINNIATLPENIKNLSKLKFLDVSYNPLIKVPESIGNLKQLRMLILKGSWIKTLPDSIAGLENLQLLVLGAGEIGTPAGCLKTLPESIGALKRLRWLLLSYNSLEKIPESIGDLQDLIELDTRANELTSLPASIGNVKSLKILDISSNKLKGLPKELDNLKCLEILNVDNNNIQDIGFKNGLLYLFKDLRSQLSEKIMQTSTQDVEELRPFLNQEKTTFTLTALRVLCRCMPLNMFSQASFIDKKSKFDKQIFKEEKMREFFALLLKEKLSFTETMQLHVQYGSFNINELLAYLKEIDVLSNNVRSTHKCSTSY